MYNDGSVGSGEISGSGVHIKIPTCSINLKIRDADFYFLIRSEPIAMEIIFIDSYHDTIWSDLDFIWQSCLYAIPV